MRWLWGHIYTDHDYRKALLDSDCYNMFLESVMLKLACIGVFTLEEATAPTTGEITGFQLGHFYPPKFPVDGFLPPNFPLDSVNTLPFSRDWYKGFGDVAMRNTGIPQGWVWIQRYIDLMSIYFVRTLDENGEINYDGKSHLFSWSSLLFEPPTRDRYGDILYTKPKNCLPYNKWWTRKYYKSIPNLKARGEPGDVAKLIAGDGADSNERGMNGWIFKMNASHRWRYDPTAIAADLIESKGPIQYGDVPGPWILNDLKQALDELRWTYGFYTGDMLDASSTGINSYFANTGNLAFNGFDKVNFKDEGFTINGAVHTTHDISLNDHIKTNQSRMRYYQLHWPYFDFVKLAGIHAHTPSITIFGYPYYIIAVVGLSTLYAPVDNTATLGSWAQPSVPTYLATDYDLVAVRGDPPENAIFIEFSFGLGDIYAIPKVNWDKGWSSGDLAGILNFTNVEGTSRHVEFYSKPVPIAGLDIIKLLHISNRSTTWRYSFAEDKQFELALGGGALSLIKWEFKYSKSTPSATFSGVKTGFMSIL